MSLSIDSLTLEVRDPEAAERFYQAAFGLGPSICARHAEKVATGFRGFSISLVVGQPSTVDALHGSAVQAGATVAKPPTKGIWVYGSVVQDRDGVVWKLATSSKKDKGPATREIDAIVLLLGASDLGASKRFYVERGLSVKRSFPGRYTEFDPAGGAVTLALYPGRAGVAKVAGVSPDGDGPPGLAAHSAAGRFTDPDGFAWEPAA
jgi:hypothetical protein